MIAVGIVGASGYTGGELLRFLLKHPQIEIVAATSRQHEGKLLSEVHPHLQDVNLRFTNPSPEEMDADLVFTATPHGASQEIVPPLVEGGMRVVDLSGDFRFDDLKLYEKWYGIPQKQALPAVYGLPELNREKIREADLVANPGCFPTGAILAALPLVKERLVDMIIIDSKTGVSGAGIKPTPVTHYPNISDNIIPYAVTTHRHAPEIQEKLNLYGETKIHFTPHLVPLIRGILTTIHTFPQEDVTPEYVQELYQEYYQAEPFVVVLNKGEIPRLSAVRGSNYCHIGCFEQDEQGRMVIISAIDNLVKGASGQAVHNMNIMYGWDETLSLEMLGMHP